MTRARHVAAAAAYLAISLWVLGSTLSSFADAFPLWTGLQATAITDGDQSHMIWAASRNARTFVTAPWRLWDFELCHPFPDAVALGHHLYANGLVGILPYALTREPILTLNVAVVAMLWVSGIGMYALAFYWTRSAAAAFIAGLLFAFMPQHLLTARWPSIVGNQWTPLALLFAHRLFVRGGWTDAAALALFLGLQLLEGFYQMVPLAVLGLGYGVSLLVQQRRRVLAVLPKLLVVASVVAVVAAFIAIPYAHVRAVWQTLEGRQQLMPTLNLLAPGQDRYPGTVLLALAAVGLLDRLRGRRGDDPRLALSFAGLLLLSVMVSGVWVGGVFHPSLLAYAKMIIPGLEAVRALQFGIVGVSLVPALLAAYGVRALIEKARPPVATAIGALLTVAVLAELFHPPFTQASFGLRDLRSAASPLPVPREAIAIADRELPDGAVLDLPAQQLDMQFRRRAHYTLVAAFIGRPTSSSFASFFCPLTGRLDALGSRLPDPRAASALHALGYRGVVLHEEEYDRPADAQAAIARLRGLAAGDPRLVEVGAAQGHHVYRLESTAPVSGDLSLLATSRPELAPLAADRIAPSAEAVRIGFRNAGPATFRQPDPIAPTPCVARWSTPEGAPVAEHPVRALLPLALAAGDQVAESIPMPVPATPGRYRVTLAPASRPDLVVGAATVDVMAGAP